MNLLKLVCLGLFLPVATPLWSQIDNTPGAVPAAVDADSSSTQMLTPPPVSGQSFPTTPTSAERSNYLRGGLAFTTAYTDNAIGSITGHPVSDVSYSIAPFITVDESTPRLQLISTYAPGFTFYQRESYLNEADQNAAFNVRYRPSQHVAVSVQDIFQKSSNVLNQPDPASAQQVSGATQQGNFSIISPIADRLSNSGNAAVSWQFAANSMVGASGTFTNLHYPDQAEVPGLFDSSSQAGLIFYSSRISKKHYIGISYQYQRLLAYPLDHQNETQTQAALFFYSFVPSSRFSISFFGGPEYADSGPQFADLVALPAPASRTWNPTAGASFNWQARLSSFALSYSHLITSGGGLIGAVRMDNVVASFRQQLSHTLSASLAGGYAQNEVLVPSPVFSDNGHTYTGTVMLQQQFHEGFNLRLGYTRLHEDYAGVAVLAATPDTNREFVSIAYQFSRPLGR
jgi:hypothetical protein